MKKCFLALLLIGGFVFSSCHKGDGTIKPKLSEPDRAELTLIPLPASTNVTNGRFEISQGLHPVLTGVNTPTVVNVVRRFEDRMVKMGLEHLTGNTSGNLKIICNEASAGLPYLTMDEGYSLTIEPDNIVIEASKYVGIEHGLQTLTYLLLDAKESGTGDGVDQFLRSFR